MNATPTGLKPNRLGNRAPVLLAGGLVLGLLAAGAWWFLESRPPAPNRAEAALTDLVRSDGRLFLRGTTNAPFTGWMTEHYPEGAVKSRSQVVDGLLHGVSEGWRTNGQLQVREHFVGGVAEGPVTKWHPDGTRLSEGLARAGRLEGTFRRWHPNGVLAEEVTLRAGQPDGLSRAWFPSGHLKAEVELEQGRVVRQQFWPDGQQPRLAQVSNPTRPPADGQTP